MKVSFYLDCMHCTSCVETVKKELLLFPEISSVNVTLVNGKVELSYEDQIPFLKIKERLFQLGYPEGERDASFSNID